MAKRGWVILSPYYIQLRWLFRTLYELAKNNHGQLDMRILLAGFGRACDNYFKNNPEHGARELMLFVLDALRRLTDASRERDLGLWTQRKREDRGRSWEMQTLDYYNLNADAFSSGTLEADMSETRARFTRCLPPDGMILDFGCGSGRDTKAFLEKGYHVDAVDGSAELCARASEYTGIQVRQMLFSELEARDWYDGVWACASILHLPRTELADVMGRIMRALVRGGVLYASFRYGDFEGMRDGRYYTDFTEETLAEFMKPISGLEIFDTWITRDVRPGREEIRWINLLARKCLGPLA